MFLNKIQPTELVMKFCLFVYGKFIYLFIPSQPTELVTREQFAAHLRLCAVQTTERVTRELREVREKIYMKTFPGKSYLNIIVLLFRFP